MPARKKIPKINLLYQGDYQTTPSSRVISWLLSTFRVIVIITEIVVVAAFASRFWLDMKNNDLDERLQQKKAIIEASGKFEKDFRDIQNRLRMFSSLTAKASAPSDVLDNISANIPPDMLLTSVRIGEKSTEIEGMSPGEKKIQQFVTNLINDEGFENVQIKEVSTDQQGLSLLTFKISVEIAKGSEE